MGHLQKWRGNMKKVFPAKEMVDESGNIKKLNMPATQAFVTQWPVYKPYKIYEKTHFKLVPTPNDRIVHDEKSGLSIRYCQDAVEIGTGEWVISGNYQKYWQVWEGNYEEITFINPSEERKLLRDFLAIDVTNNESILQFVNRYGLLGIDFLQSPVWIVAQTPNPNFGVVEEDLLAFVAEVRCLQDVYKLWKTQKEDAFEEIVKVLQRKLFGIVEYPQLKDGKIVPGKKGLCLLHYIWLQFYELVIGNWSECKLCGNLFEKTHGLEKYCPECRMPGQTPPWKKLQRMKKRKGEL